jgi:class 3 adenylate cyclase
MKKQEASILFIELSGFSTDTESNPADGLQLLLDQIYQLLDTTVRLHHGSINRFTGDTLIAVFAGNKTTRGTAVVAIQSAQEISEQLVSMSQEAGLEPPIRIKTGVATGTILVSEIGHNDNKQTTLLGDAVINAGRISQFAETGQLLTDERSAENAKTFFEFQKLEPLPIRGGAEVLPIFEVTARKRKKLELKTTGERKIASEMVGRSREMEQMEGLFKQLLAGKGCIVNVVGKAGIGKSRLITEMKVQPVMEKVLMLEGRALSTGQNLSYHPVIHLIKSWAGITEDDPPAHASEKLFQGIQRNQPEQADEIYAFLATMMGLPLEGRHKERVQGIEGDALEKLILKNLRDLIIAATRDTPRIYLIEDMHWSDASSIKLFESLYKLSQNHPVMFVNVLRPGYSETGDHILKYLVDNFPGDHITVHVSPLDASDSGQLIQNLTQDIQLPESVKATIIRKTEGNPFFIEEVIRSFIDEGIIEVENNIFRVTDQINEVNIPETINEVILSRIDKLDEKTKELLKTASVIGRNFYFKVLEEAADTIGELDERLQYLKEVQLIGESKKKDDIEFLFKHALAQQATYESIVLDTKKELHLKIARSIEKVFVEKINEFFGTLAMHYGKAGMSEKKLEYLIKAGDEAFKSGASNEALSHYKEALILMPAKPSSAQGRDIIRDIHINIGFAQNAAGHNIEAIETFEMILQKYYSKKFPKTTKSEKFYGLWGMILLIAKVNLYAYLKHKTPSAETNLLFKLLINWGEAIATLNPRRFLLLSMHFTKDVLDYKITGSPNAISLTADCSTFFTWSGMSFTVGRKMLGTAKKAGAEKYPYNIIDYRYTYEMYRFHVGNWEVDQDFESVYRGALQFGRYWETTVYVLFNGFFYVELGRYDKMIEMAGKMNEISESFDNSHAKAQMYRFLAMSHFRFRKIPEALKSAEEGIAYTGKTGHHAMLLVIWCAKSLTHSIMNQPGEAQSALDEAEKYIKDRKVVSIYHGAYLTAKVYIELAELNTSVQQKCSYKKQAKTLLTSVNKLIRLSKKLRSAETEAYRLKAIAFRLLNKPAKACKYFTFSIGAGEKLNHNLELSRTWFEAGKFLSDPKTGKKMLNGLTGKDYLEKAKTLYEEMDLQWDLEEYRKCVG